MMGHFDCDSNLLLKIQGPSLKSIWEEFKNALRTDHFSRATCESTISLLIYRRLTPRLGAAAVGFAFVPATEMTGLVGLTFFLAS